MIEFIQGNIVEKNEDYIVIEKGGVGFKIYVPYEIEDGKVYTKLVVKDDGFFLYGFKNREDRDLFEQLTGITGIGVKHAFSILKRFTGGEVIQIIDEGDVQALMDVPGIGKKTAQRIIFELKGKLQFFENELLEDIVNALLSLGFEKKDAVWAAREALKETKELEIAIKKALQKLSEKG
ncbi:Holliday junction branch migration protein RuvA [Persephonella sp. IF05-L8]|uniref:Holliday junction branch migration protein RuvA n=1 Tax=Persephonella sp. IF05-L8 TaxID=1158338 RepID=UPI0004957831